MTVETGVANEISEENGELLGATVSGWSGDAIVVRPDFVIAGGHELVPRDGPSGRVDALLVGGGRIKRAVFERVE